MVLSSSSCSPNSLRPAPETVLVVDDDPATRLLTSRWLEKSGVQVRTACDGREALSFVNEDPDAISVIVLDVMMPGMDGFEVLGCLQDDAATREIPVVLLTAHANDEMDVIRGIEIGAVEHLAKPFRGPILVARTSALMAKRRSQFELRCRLDQAEKEATTDALTGLANRRDFERALQREVAFTQRHHAPLSVLFIDIDHFKSINDLFGHPAGDHVLQVVSEVIKEALRKEDAAYRLGGEEFAVLLRDTDAERAAQCARRLQDALRESPVEFESGDQRTVRFSAGVASAEAGNEFAAERLVDRADEALYQAKRGGRDRVVIEGGSA